MAAVQVRLHPASRLRPSLLPLWCYHRCATVPAGREIAFRSEPLVDIPLRSGVVGSAACRGTGAGAFDCDLSACGGLRADGLGCDCPTAPLPATPRPHGAGPLRSRFITRAVITRAVLCGCCGFVCKWTAIVRRRRSCRRSSRCSVNRCAVLIICRRPASPPLLDHVVHPSQQRIRGREQHELLAHTRLLSPQRTLSVRILTDVNVGAIGFSAHSQH